MPCEVVLLRVFFFKMAAVAMETTKIPKKLKKHKNDLSRLLVAEQKLMKLDRNNIHIQWNEISQQNRNRLDKLCRSCHGNKKGGNSKHFWIPFIKLHETLQEYPPQCVASLGVEQIQNDGRCHGNQGAKNVKFTPNFTNVCSNVSCHNHIQWNEISQTNRNQQDKLCRSCNGNKKVGILIFFLFLSSNS